MRAKDFLNEENIFEINMSPTSLKSLAADIDARAGMEFEMIVPNVDTDDGDLEPDYDMDERCSDFDDIRNFFEDDVYNGRREVERLLDELTGEYQEVMDERMMSAWDNDGYDFLFRWIKDNVSEEDIASELGIDIDAEDYDGLTSEDFETFVEKSWGENDGNYESALDEYRDDYYSDFSEGDFLRYKGYRYMSDIQNNFDITWPHWTTSNDGEADINEVAQNFEHAVGRPVKASQNYHSGSVQRPSKSQQHYVVEPDGSLDGDNSGDTGLEFVSPPLPLSELLSDLQKVKKFADTYDCYTNDSTGLHINISVPGYSLEKLDFVKLALLMGDEYILDKFGRATNTYAKSAMKMVRDRVANQPEDAGQLLAQMKGTLSDMATKIVHSGNTSKYTSINTKDGYIEFRSPGGDWLNENFDKIESTLLRFTVALDAAIDPQKYRAEYLKKLYTLLAPKSTGDTMGIFAKYAAGEMPKGALKSFIRQAQLERQTKKAGPAAQAVRYEIYNKQTGNSVVDAEGITNDSDALIRLNDYIEHGPHGLQRGQAQRMFGIRQVGGQPAQPASAPAQQYEIYDRITGQAVQQYPAADDEAALIYLDDYRRHGPHRLNSRDATERFGARAVRPNQPPPPRPIPGVTDIDIDIPMAGSTRDLQQQRASSGFTGAWRVTLDGEEVYRFSGIGNNQADANRIGQQWAQDQIRQGLLYPAGEIEITPIMS